MPIYEYQCQSCQHDFEYLVLGREEPDRCPACESKKVCRRLSVCGFISKGSAGETVSTSSSSCSGCAATSCSSCGH